jgi:hypothetical protein
MPPVTFTLRAIDDQSNRVNTRTDSLCYLLRTGTRKVGAVYDCVSEAQSKRLAGAFAKRFMSR